MSDLDMEKLEAIFWGDQREQPTRVRLARVVKALREGIVPYYLRGDIERPVQWYRGLFNDILGDAGNEKVAGGSSSNADKATEAGGARCATTCASAPATDPIRNAVAMARGRALAVDDIPTLNKLAAMMSPATDFVYTGGMNDLCVTDPAPAVCNVCRGAGFIYVRTMHDPDGPLEKQECEECHSPAPDVCEWRDDAYIGCFTTSCSDDAAWNRLGGTPKDEGYNFCPSCGKPIKFTEAK